MFCIAKHHFLVVRAQGAHLEVRHVALYVIRNGIVAVDVGYDLSKLCRHAAKAAVVQANMDSRRRQSIFEKDVAMSSIGALSGGDSGRGRSIWRYDVTGCSYFRLRMRSRRGRVGMGGHNRERRWVG